MHSKVRQNDEGATIDSQPNTILPQSLDVEAEGAENSGARDFNVEAVFVVDEGEIFDFVHNEAFECVVEYG